MRYVSVALLCIVRTCRCKRLVPKKDSQLLEDFAKVGGRVNLDGSLQTLASLLSASGPDTAFQAVQAVDASRTFVKSSRRAAGKMTMPQRNGEKQTQLSPFANARRHRRADIEQLLRLSSSAALGLATPAFGEKPKYEKGDPDDTKRALRQAKGAFCSQEGIDCNDQNDIEMLFALEKLRKQEKERRSQEVESVRRVMSTGQIEDVNKKDKAIAKVMEIDRAIPASRPVAIQQIIDAPATAAIDAPAVDYPPPPEFPIVDKPKAVNQIEGESLQDRLARIRAMDPDTYFVTQIRLPADIPNIEKKIPPGSVATLKYRMVMVEGVEGPLAVVNIPLDGVTFPFEYVFKRSWIGNKVPQEMLLSRTVYVQCEVADPGVQEADKIDNEAVQAFRKGFLNKLRFTAAGSGKARSSSPATYGDGIRGDALVDLEFPFT